MYTWYSTELGLVITRLFMFRLVLMLMLELVKLLMAVKKIEHSIDFHIYSNNLSFGEDVT